MAATIGGKIGTALFSFVAFALGMFAIVLFLAVALVAWQFGTVGTGFVSGLTLAMVVVVLTLGSYMMARAFKR